jgi:hypothetical protein
MTIPTQNGWVRCPQGELGRLAVRLRVRYLLRVSLGVAAALVGAGLALGAAYLVSDWTSPSAQRCAPCHDNCAPPPSPVEGGKSQTP